MSKYSINSAITILALWSIWPISAEQSEFTEHFSIHVNQTGYSQPHITQRAMYNGTSISISVVNCDGMGKYMVQWMIRYTQCYNYDDQLPSLFFKNAAESALDEETKFWYYKCDVPTMQMCGGLINPLTDESDRKWTVEPPLQGGTTPRTTHQMSHRNKRVDRSDEMESMNKLGRHDPSTDISYKSIYTNSNRVSKTIRDGHYIILVYINSFTDEDLKVDLEVKLQSVRVFPQKYPNAVIPFYIALCGVYVMQTIVWLNFIIRNYRRTLRIHNLMTSILLISITQSLATFIHQERVNIWAVSSLNTDDVFIIVLNIAKIVMFLFFMILFSLGDGIAKQNLGKRSSACLTIVLGIFGVLYLSLLLYRLNHHNMVITTVLTITISLLGLALILWIARNLVQTIRRLHLQREWAKMFLYIIVTIGLIAYSFTDIVYLAMYLKETPTCITTAWPILFEQGALLSVISSAFLCIVMILIRPTVSNLRFLNYKQISDDTERNGASHEHLLKEQQHIETAV